MSRPQQSIQIVKSRRGWSVESTVRYDGWPNPAITNSGHRTLASALWQAIDTSMAVMSVTVKGSVISNAEAFEVIRKDLQNGMLAYQLPRYRKALGA